MAAGVRIDPASAADAEPIADVWLRSRRAVIPQIPAPIHTDDEVRAYFAHHVVPSLDTWVARADDPAGTVVGVLVLADDFVDHLYVDPPHQGSHVGSRLLSHAKEMRPDGLRLWTFQANAGARRFYERHGFRATAETDGDNEEGEPDVLYEWDPPG